jgi:uncharacterized surface protein with fasciclin (FAS1) repeats
MNIIRLGVRARAVLGIALLGVLAACSDSNNYSAPEPPPPPPPPAGPGTIVEVASETEGFETLVTALDAAGLVSTLDDESASFTVFAPTDEAFAALPEGALDALLEDIDALTNVLTYHVIDGAVDSAAATDAAGTTVEMVNGGKVAVTLRDGELFINEAKVTTTDIEASNGIIHVIDAVLLPPDLTPSELTIAEIATADDRFETLVAAATAADLVGTLSDPDATLTVFAPTDDAFAMLGQTTIDALLLDIDRLTNVLLYHVISGSAVDSIGATAAFGTDIEMANGDMASIDIVDGTLKINGSNVIIKDIVAANGIIHVIDAVLAPPSAGPGTIVEVAAANGAFTTLLTAVEAAELTGALLDPTADLTVFAPTDDAFAAVDSAALEALLADQAALSNVLLYHLYQGQVDSETAISLDGSDVEMLNGDTVSISVVDGDLFINDAKVIIADVPANNGVIHAIDAVLMPPAPEPASFEFSDDFESADPNLEAPIVGWTSYVNVFNGGAYLYGYGFPSKVSNEQISNISTEVGEGQGTQVLNVFSDYTNGDHNNGADIEANIFREFVIQEGDVGEFRFEFDAKRPAEFAIDDRSAAGGFIKLLDPNAGYATVYYVTEETTALGTDAFTTLGIDVTINGAEQAGIIIQFGFTNTVTAYNPSGVLYDNVSVSRK